MVGSRSSASFGPERGEGPLPTARGENTPHPYHIDQAACEECRRYRLLLFLLESIPVTCDRVLHL